MSNHECVAFLQWALPQRHMRWPGYRKVRRQVCKRVDRRIRELGLDGVELIDGPLKGVTARAVVVIDENDEVTYTELVPVIGEEPNYDAALAAVS